eukprot:1273599-Prymnesium_polylepis.1
MAVVPGSVRDVTELTIAREIEDDLVLGIGNAYTTEGARAVRLVTRRVYRVGFDAEPPPAQTLV